MATGFEFDNELGLIIWRDQFVIVSGRPYSCPVAVSVGDAVFITGADAVDRADASSVATSPAFGFVRFKPSTTSCLVQSAGEMDAFGALVAGDTYYLSDSVPGGITNVAPSGGPTVQPLAFARNATTLVILIDPADVLTQ